MRNLGVIPGRGKVFFFPLLQAFRLAATYSMGNEGSFHRDKGGGVEVLPLTPSSWWVKYVESSIATAYVSCVIVHKTPGQLLPFTSVLFSNLLCTSVSVIFYVTACIWHLNDIANLVFQSHAQYYLATCMALTQIVSHDSNSYPCFSLWCVC